MRTSKQIDDIINLVESDLGSTSQLDERTRLQAADNASLSAGEQLEAAVDDASKLLSDIRSIIAMRDQDEVSAGLAASSRGTAFI